MNPFKVTEIGENSVFISTVRVITPDQVNSLLKLYENMFNKRFYHASLGSHGLPDGSSIYWSSQTIKESTDIGANWKFLKNETKNVYRK